MLVTTGSACAPIAEIVATSPATPLAPLGSLALKLITQAGVVCSCCSADSLSVVVDSALMGWCPSGVQWVPLGPRHTS